MWEMHGTYTKTHSEGYTFAKTQPILKRNTLNDF